MTEYRLARQAVLDAALDLLELRRRVIERLDRSQTGRIYGAETVAAADPTAWTMRESHAWRSLLSTRPVTQAGNLRRSLGNNREMLAHGMKMRSIFDTTGTTASAVSMLAGERQPAVYLIGPAPVQMRLVDGAVVLLPGRPTSNSIVRVTQPAVLAAARDYWNAALEHARPCGCTPDCPEGLTTRQHLVLELLARGDTDALVAETLGVSLRTVQAEVAAVMRAVGVASRFALGLEVARRSLLR